MIDRENQARFAEILLPLVENTRDVETLNRLHALAALVLEWSGYDDNGIAFDLSEYTFEAKEAAAGRGSDGWGKHAKSSLQSQIDALRST